MRDKYGCFKKGHKFWLGKKHSQKSIEKMSEVKKELWKDKKFRKKTIESLKQSWINTKRKEKASVTQQRIWKNPNLIAKVSGKNSCHWKRGVTKSTQGYIWIYMPKHPYAIHRIYVPEHRFVIEKQIGRYMKPNEHTHHLNGIKIDNRPENLIAFSSNSAHIRFEKNGIVKPNEIIFDGRKIHA